MAIRIFHHYWQLPLVLLAVAEAGIAFGAVYLSATLRFGPDFYSNTGAGEWLYRATLFTGAMFVTAAAVGLYSSRQRSRLAGLLARLAAAMCAAIVFVAVMSYLFPDLAFGRGVLLLAATLAFFGSTVVRVAFDRLVDENVFKRRVLIYGAGKRAASIVRLRRRSDRRGFFVVGYLAADGDDVSAVPEEERRDASRGMLQLCEKYSVDEIVVAMDDRRVSFPMEELLECRLEGVEVTELITFLERETGKVRLDVLNPSWMIFSEGFRQGRMYSAAERILDILASLLLLVLTLPVMLFTAVAIKIEEGLTASILYGQVRVGQYGRPFKLLKFRSMRENAESDGKARYAQTNDPRVTRIGSFIRKVRIDELPQIINVLRGHMSFVGPRPERPEFVSHLNERVPYYRERHAVKPGITGWAQLCYPYGSSEQDSIEKLQYDLYYVKNHSPLFYLAIVVQTVEVVLWRKGSR